MGTNFYLKVNVCPHCGTAEEELHIGKSSAGWCFSLHVIPERGIDGLEAWEKLWPTGRIFDEYGTELTSEQMRKRITDRRLDRPQPDDPEWHRINHSEPGPNNLARHRIGPYCLSHGEGTWDCIPGNFS